VDAGEEVLGREAKGGLGEGGGGRHGGSPGGCGRSRLAPLTVEQRGGERTMGCRGSMRWVRVEHRDGDLSDRCGPSLVGLQGKICETGRSVRRAMRR
jgi:hypothetical protein